MHIVVCVKQVPDSSQIRVHPVTNTIMRQGVPAVVNPYDLVSLEEALRIRDRFGARVTVLSMGPKMAIDALRKCVSFGADDAVLITDRVFAGSDTLATSYALASAIRTIGADHPVDMVFCGKQTIDGDTAHSIAPHMHTHANRDGSSNTFAVGYWHDDWVRTPAGWRISFRRVEQLYFHTFPIVATPQMVSGV